MAGGGGGWGFFRLEAKLSFCTALGRRGRSRSVVGDSRCSCHLPASHQAVPPWDLISHHSRKHSPKCGWEACTSFLQLDGSGWGLHGVPAPGALPSIRTKLVTGSRPTQAERPSVHSALNAIPPPRVVPSSPTSSCCGGWTVKAAPTRCPGCEQPRTAVTWARPPGLPVPQFLHLQSGMR